MKPLRVQVYCRVRNADLADNQQLRLLPDQTTIQVVRTTHGLAGDETAVQSYAFDGVLSGAAATQEAIYASTTSAMIEGGVLHGVSGTVVCYGVRNTGKSYTLFGGTDYRTRGLAPRVVQHLFKGIAGFVNERVYQVDLSFVQLFGQQVVDLLAEPLERTSGLGRPSVPPPPLRPSITLDGKGEVQLKNIVRRRCADEAEALAALFEGVHVARGAGTNSTPRASHLVVTLYVHYRSAADTDSETRLARCNLVELASPQRVEDVTGYEQRTEVQLMNRSLSTLEQVVTQLAQLHVGSSENPTPPSPRAGPAKTSAPHVPYRQSKLTTLLKGSIGGRCLTTFIAHITLSKAAHEATTSTLNFARRMMRITVNPSTNVTINAEAQVRALQQQVADLKAELRLQGQLRHAQAKASVAEPAAQVGGGTRASVVSAGAIERAARLPPHSLNVGVDELQQLQQRVHAFVEGTTATMQLGDVREMHACFALLRNLLEEKDQQLAQLRNEMTSSKNVTGSVAAHDHGNAVSTRSTNERGAREPRSSPSQAGSSVVGGADKAAEPYTPSVLDPSRGVGYGTSTKPSAAAVIARMTVVTPPIASMANPTSTTRDVSRQTHLLTSGPPSAALPPIHGGGAAETTAKGTSGGVGYTQHDGAELQPRARSTGGGGDVTVVGRVAHGHEVRDRPATCDAGTACEQEGQWDQVSTRVQPRPSTYAGLRSPRLGLSEETLAQTTSMLWTRQHVVQEAAQMAAFELYKQTTSGALQVRVLSEDRQQLAQKQAELARVEQRLQWCGAVMREQSSSAVEPSRLLGSGETVVHAAMTENNESAAASLAPPRTGLEWEGSYTTRLAPASAHGTESLGQMEAVHELRQLRALPLAHVTAYYHRLREQLRRHASESSYLANQVRRRQAALLRNFEVWYAQQRDAPGSGTLSRPPTPQPRPCSSGGTTAHGAGLPQLLRPGVGGAAGVEQPPPPPKASCAQTECEVAAWVESAGDCYLDAAERFDAMEMQRELALDPESAAYFSAKRAVRARRREHKTVAATEGIQS